MSSRSSSSSCGGGSAGVEVVATGGGAGAGTGAGTAIGAGRASGTSGGGSSRSTIWYTTNVPPMTTPAAIHQRARRGDASIGTSASSSAMPRRHASEQYTRIAVPSTATCGLPTLTAPWHRGQARAGVDRGRDALGFTACSVTTREDWKGVDRKAIAAARAMRFRGLASVAWTSRAPGGRFTPCWRRRSTRGCTWLRRATTRRHGPRIPFAGRTT